MPDWCFLGFGIWSKGVHCNAPIDCGMAVYGLHVDSGGHAETLSTRWLEERSLEDSGYAWEEVSFHYFAALSTTNTKFVPRI